MTVTIPAAVNLHTTSHSADARARGTTGTISVTAKNFANMPLTSNASTIVNNTASSATGTPGMIHYEFLATGSYDVSSSTKVLLCGVLFGTSERIQVPTLANGGIRVRISSGSGSPPTNYKEYAIGGRDTIMGSSQYLTSPYVIDLNDTSNEYSGGTFDNTAAEVYGWGVIRHNMVGTLGCIVNMVRAHVFDTGLNDTNIPLFTGTGNSWDTLVDAVQGSDYTDKIGEWCFNLGDSVFVPIPWQIGDGTTAITFDDGGVGTVVAPVHDDADDPRFRLTSQALRGYVRTRDNAADIVRFGKTYDYGGAQQPDLDFNNSNAGVINLAGSRWIGRGDVTLGSSCTGAAIWESCGTVDATAGPDVDGSTFRSPTADGLLIDSTQTLADLRFETYNSQVALNVGAGASDVTITLDNCFFDKSGTFEVENSGSGVVTLDLINGTTALVEGTDTTNTGGGSIIVKMDVTATVKILDGRDNSNLQNAHVILKASDGTGDLPYQDSVTITRSGSTATVSHTAHGVPDGKKVEIKGANEIEYNGAKTITVTGANSYTFPVSGTPATPATGTITATGLVLEGLTDASGEISDTRTWTNPQPVIGRASKGPPTPIFADRNLIGTISTTAGLDITQALDFDES